MATSTITFNVSLAWWVMPYVRTVALLCQLLDVEPNMARIGYWVGKGIKLRITGHRPPRPIPQPRPVE